MLTADFTPISESEQYGRALKLRGVDTVLLRVPERSHYLVGMPSQLVAKSEDILGGGLERYREGSTKVVS